MDPLTLSAQSVDGGSTRFSLKIDRLPDKCPLCHLRVSPTYVAGIWLDLGTGWQRLDATFLCTSRSCSHLFLASYISKRGLYELKSVAPQTAEKSEFSAEIREVSPTFVEIFDQSIAAQGHGLEQLTGIGLRKALEFLIKDFCVREKPDDRDAIVTALLGQCIAKFVDDANIKECAKRAAWLGNDETHYERRWVDKDITDLKRLITLSANWIENVLLTRKYVEEMPPK